MLGFLILGLVLITVLFKYKKIVVIGFCILFLVLGIWRHQTVEVRSMKSELIKHNDTQENITLIGVISDEPDIGEKVVKFEIVNLKLLIEDKWQDVSGKILVTTNRYPEYQSGDKLKIAGKLKTPSEDIEGFNYKDYLLKDGIYSVMDWPKIELIDTSTRLSINPELAEWIDKNQGNILYKYLFFAKNKLKEVMK